ncbi:MAG: DUF3990 domain-containing protein [Bacilli bacterium]
MKFNISNDLVLIREFFQISQKEFANILGVDRLTLIRTENGNTYPRIELMDKFYNYCFNKGLKLNLQKEMFYKDDIKSNHILLTHASKNGINGNITIEKSRINNDFGKGFYCGDSYDKSISFICRFPESCVYFLDFDPKDLNCVRFEVNTEWMLAIAYFRGKLENYKNSDVLKKIIAPILKADYVIAPIADNRMFQIIDTFIEGEITDEQCRHCLAATNLGMQYVFLTNKSIDHLEIIERCFVSSSEKQFFKNEQLKFQKVGNDKSRLARIQYRGKGKYIEEILL